MSGLGFIGVALVYAGLAVGGWPGGGLVAIGAVALVAAAWTRRDGLLLLGPFARWELIRTARTSLWYVWRPLIGWAALLVAWMYTLYATDRDGTLHQRELSRAAGNAFYMIGGWAVGLGSLFAVAQLPGVIAEEREKNRLEHLFVTDLRNRELLVGKAVGRLAVLAGYVLVPLPVLALLTLVGGVDPVTVAALGVMYLGSLFALAGVAVACSAVSNKTSTAVILTVVVLIALRYAAELPEMAADFLQLIPAGAAAELPPWANTARLYAADACRFVAGGSPLTAFDRLDAATSTGTSAAGGIVRAYLAGQLLLLAAGWVIASRYLRRAPRPVGAAGGRTGPRAFFTQPPKRSPVSDRPIVWYDLTTPLSIIDRVGRKLKVGIWWVPAVLVVLFLLTLQLLTPDDFDQGFDRFVHSTGQLAFLFITIPVAWVGCRGLVRERERDTLDALLLTDLTPAEIVRQKWLAAALSARGRLLAAAAFWFTAGVLRPNLLPAAVALTVVTCGYAALAAAIGVWMSVRAKSGNKAFLWLVVMYSVWTFGSCMLTSCAFIPAAFGLSPVSIGFAGLLAVVNPLAVQTIAGYIGWQQGRADADLFNLLFAAVTALGVLVAAAATVGFLRAAEWHFTRQRRPRPRRYE